MSSGDFVMDSIHSLTCCSEEMDLFLITSRNTINHNRLELGAYVGDLVYKYNLEPTWTWFINTTLSLYDRLENPSIRSGSEVVWLENSFVRP